MNNTVPVEFESDQLEMLREAQDPRTPSRERHLRIASERPARAAKPGLSPLIGSLVAVGILLAILAGQLGLSIALSQGAYEARALEIEQRDLARVERALAQNVTKLASPQNLAENATALGMVQNSQPASLRLSDGVILGSLESKTSEAGGNLVPNSTLESMPVVDAEGLLVSRQKALAGKEKPLIDPPVRWKGELPVPDTH